MNPTPNPGEYGPGVRASLFAHDQDLGTSGPFGVGEHAMLLDDERPPEWDHHQDAEQPPSTATSITFVHSSSYPSSIKAGMAAPTPNAIDSPAEPAV